ncbi:MAG: putative ABC transporter permease [Bacilli bacterium]|nr:putative ABC transporter permease [Bacilli bacterium]MDD4796078.1 putative ABC transporter permease [Bacilli bacterium]
MIYLNIFHFFSIIGYILETLFIKNYNSGILYLPWTPVYGISILIAIFINKKIENISKKKLLKIFIHFVSCALILSCLEFISGHLIELIFNKVYWNYDSFKYNLGKYISLETALIWGISSTLTVYLIYPHLSKILKKVPKWWTIVLTIIFLIDIIITFIVKEPLSLRALYIL